MDVFLGRVTSQAMNYAIRSGVTITTTYALKQCGRLLKETPRSQHRAELMQLQLRLDSKIRIISPAIDMIELISARGNTSLESAVSLTKEIRYEIQRLGTRLSHAANDEELLRRKSTRAKSRDETERELKAIINEIKKLLVRIEDAVPLINLAITTSGVNLSTKLSGTISPSRLIQASTFLTAADSKYAAQPGRRVQVGPTYTLSLYMLFAGHAWRPIDENGIRETTWKEVIHKARLKLMRVPLEGLYDLPGESTSSAVDGATADTIPGEAKAAEFAYQMVLVEDLDDDRVHTFEDDEEQPGPFEEVATAGIRDVLPIHEISKVFYADTGKILNIGSDSEINSPVLLLRRDVHAEPPRRMLHRSQMGDTMGYYDDSVLSTTEVDGEHNQQSDIDAQLHGESAPNTPVKESPSETHRKSAAWRLPADLDPEWMAFEVYVEEPDSESDPEEPSLPSSREDSPGQGLTSALSKLNLKSSTPTASPTTNGQHQLMPSNLSPRPAGPPIKTSLSLLEMLMKLTALQQFRQESHLAIEDELLNFFLEDSSTAGAGPDKDYRQRLRHDAVRRVGFDPYDESPIKHRGEEYIQHARGAASPRPGFDPYAFHGELPQAESTPDFVRPSIERPDFVRGSPSSPSPVRQQAPSKHPTTANGAPHTAAPRTSSQASLLATPPGTARNRQAYLRAQSEPKVRSPLARELRRSQGRDEGVETSLGSEEAEGVEEERDVSH
ncbi:Ran-specific GTPase-activating protein 30 [Vermiconidia calcicola]|uniref:Ran-specific GTPase-activating protein 30 n=1 Tax=Vermiconidia calcicola TaxID=1690605 RepID=A0ACC3NIF1_9PEZI|nr:Ran-specific GTPase-activating protein 30 [Vermiconidia calcicola]